MKDIRGLLRLAIKASVYAGKEILEVYDRDDFKITSKEDKTPLTLADSRAHNKIIEYLDQTNIPVLSEEGIHLPYEDRKKWDYFWLVDPLDGTKEFIKRNGEFTVNIALIEKNTPMAGVIYVPVSKILYFANGDQGAYKITDVEYDDFDDLDFEVIRSNAQKLPLVDFERSFTVVGSRSHMSEETEKFIIGLKEEHDNLEMISIGSSLKQCMIAEGKADIYPRFGPTMEWDTGAGHAIVNASGGCITKVDGTPLVYNKENLLNPHFIVKGNLFDC